MKVHPHAWTQYYLKTTNINLYKRKALWNSSEDAVLYKLILFPHIQNFLYHMIPRQLFSYQNCLYKRSF